VRGRHAEDQEGSRVLVVTGRDLKRRGRNQEQNSLALKWDETNVEKKGRTGGVGKRNRDLLKNMNDPLLKSRR